MKHVLIALLLLCLVGCINRSPLPSTSPVVRESTPAPPLAKTVNLANSRLIKQRLLAQYAEWKGTPYQLGGLSKNGIDCSGFVFLTFKTQLGLAVQRSTALLVKEGVEVAQNQLRAGDLVFFKTGVFVRHVGMYLGDSKFLHASKSVGVTVSSLHNSYWSSHYWVSRRVQP